MWFTVILKRDFLCKINPNVNNAFLKTCWKLVKMLVHNCGIKHYSVYLKRPEKSSRNNCIGTTLSPGKCEIMRLKFLPLRLK